MPRPLLRYLLDVALLLTAAVVILTGLLVDRLDLHQFAPHRWAGYTLAGLIAVHAVLHWRFLLAPFGARGRAHRRPRIAAPPSGRDTAPEAAAMPGQRVGAGLTRRTALAAGLTGLAGGAAGWVAKDAVSPTPYRGGDVGLFYHRESSLGVWGLIGSLTKWGRRPAKYKRVDGAAAVALPTLPSAPTLTVAQALQQRRSLRSYHDRSLTAQELGWLVLAATGITTAGGYRTSPSAGALYPIETYVAVKRVQGIDPGLYHVDVRAQALEPVRTGSVAGDVMVAGLGQEFLRDAPVVLVLTGLFQRTRWKYHERHYRYVCWEGGHIAQNIYLAAEATGLGACMVGAFLDGMLNDLLLIDGWTEAALGLIAVGPR